VDFWWDHATSLPLLWKTCAPGSVRKEGCRVPLRMIASAKTKSLRASRANIGPSDAELTHSEQKIPGQAGRIQGARRVEKFSFTTEPTRAMSSAHGQRRPKGRADRAHGGSQAGAAQIPRRRSLPRPCSRKPPRKKLGSVRKDHARRDSSCTKGGRHRREARSGLNHHMRTRLLNMAQRAVRGKFAM